MAKLSEGLGACYAMLYDAPESSYTQIRSAIRRIDDLVRVDERLAPLLEALKPAQIAVDEASTALRDYLGRLEGDPERLEQVETRLATIEKLKRKYGATSRRSCVSRRGAVEPRGARKQRRAACGHREAAVGAWQAVRGAGGEAERAASGGGAQARKAGRVRVEVAGHGTDGIQGGFVEPAEWSESGADALRFLVSPNLGEEPKPLDKIASGGELSRVALALKTCITAGAKRRSAARALVFDEVDAGIGGAAAESVGRRLKRLAGTNQVLCVTHLAQIAGFADHHFAVEKRESKGRTVAVVEELRERRRTREIGRMLSGRLTPEALKHAEQLIKTASS